MGSDILLKSLYSPSGREAEIFCECLVIGSGAGGSLTSSYLSKIGKDVLVVEEGPYFENNSWLTTTSSFPDVWREGGLIPVIGKTKMVFAEGRCLGGSTMMNAALINRISEEVALDWAKNWQVDGFDFKTVEKYQDRIASSLGANIFSTAGNLAAKYLKDGAEKLGFRGSDIPMAAKITSSGFKKNNMRETFLRDAASRGARIITDCRIEKIFFRGLRAVSARAVLSGNGPSKGILKINFDKLFLCAGSVQTPLLLRRSGLKKNIGDSLQFHVNIKIAAEFKEPINAYAYEMPSFQVKEFAPKITLGASMSAPPLIASALTANWSGNKSSLRNLNKIGLYYAAIKSDAKAQVRNLSSSGRSYLITYNLNDEDFKNLKLGCEKLSELLLAGGAERLYPAVDGASAIENKTDIKNYLESNFSPKKLNLASIHAFSSCPMGEDKTKTAIDSYGKIHDMENIYIHDASVLPSSPGANPQGPMMAVVLRNLEKNFV